MSIINDVLVDKLFKDSPKRTKEIPLLSEKTVSGDGTVVINDAYPDFPFKNITLQGNTQQDSTTGAQLFDAKTIVRDMVIEFDGSLVSAKEYFTSDFIKVEPSMTYFINATGSKRGKYFDENKKVISTNTFSDFIPESGTVITTPEKTSYIRFSGLIGNIETVMLNKGSSATPYEPYTGWKPSPSPEYPQEIKNVGKLNEKTGKYEVDVKVAGKNTLNPHSITDAKAINADGSLGDAVNNCVTDFLFFKWGNIYYISLDNSDGITINGYIYDLDKANGSYYFASTSNTRKIVPEKDCYMRLTFNRAKEVMLNRHIQVEENDNNTPYQPYREPQTLTLTSDRPITKWDKLVERDGQIGWLYQSEELVLNGDEEWVLYDYENAGVSFYTSFPNSAIGYKNSLVKEMINVNQSWTNKHAGIYSIYSDHPTTLLKYFRPPSDKIKTVDEWKAWLYENTLTIVYKTSESTFIPLPQSEQDAIRALTTYYPTTVVTVDGGELPVGIEVTYMKPDYIPTKQSALRMWFKENSII